MMEKTRCKLNICGVDITVSGDVDREAVERIGQAVRVRMQNALRSSGTATVEKAAVITAMNFCEELARRDERYRELEKKVQSLEDELREARLIKRRLTQTEAKLHIAEEQLARAEEEKKTAEVEEAKRQTEMPDEPDEDDDAPVELPQLRVIARPPVPRRSTAGETLRNPLRTTPDGDSGLRPFYLKKQENT